MRNSSLMETGVAPTWSSLRKPDAELRSSHVLGMLVCLQKKPLDVRLLSAETGLSRPEVARIAGWLAARGVVRYRRGEENPVVECTPEARETLQSIVERSRWPPEKALGAMNEEGAEGFLELLVVLVRLRTWAGSSGR